MATVKPGSLQARQLISAGGGGGGGGGGDTRGYYLRGRGGGVYTVLERHTASCSKSAIVARKISMWWYKIGCFT